MNHGNDENDICCHHDIHDTEYKQNNTNTLLVVVRVVMILNNIHNQMVAVVLEGGNERIRGGGAYMCAPFGDRQNNGDMFLEV